MSSSRYALRVLGDCGRGVAAARPIASMYASLRPERNSIPPFAPHPDAEVSCALGGYAARMRAGNGANQPRRACGAL